MDKKLYTQETDTDLHFSLLADSTKIKQKNNSL